MAQVRALMRKRVLEELLASEVLEVRVIDPAFAHAFVGQTGNMLEQKKPDTTQRLTGREIERAYVDKGYRGHDAPNPRRVFISGQKRGVFGRIKRELRRRSAIEAVIGHMKAEGHLGRCYLKGRAGDAANVILSAVGYNLRVVLAWLRMILRSCSSRYSRPSQFDQPSNQLFNGRL
jgi:transposase, IS5 family